VIEVAVLDRAIATVLAEQRAALTAAFGWTQLELEAHAMPGRLRLRGCVALPRVTAGVCRALAPLLPPGWSIDATQVQVRAPIGWRAPGPGVTRLWRTSALALSGGVDGAEDMSVETCPRGQADMGLSTELLPGDGALALLTALPGCMLVRASDGTVGWVRGALAPLVPVAPVNEAARLTAGPALRRLSARLRSYLGVRYRLGGATRRHIDCSGLVQRGVREALGLVLPRHSSDQLALGAAPVRAMGEPGDLLFMGGTEGAAWHVGVVLGGARRGTRTLIHASARRGVVVEEPLERGLLRAAGRVLHIELAQLLDGMRGVADVLSPP